jgi:hypothetical protein
MSALAVHVLLQHINAWPVSACSAALAQTAVLRASCFIRLTLRMAACTVITCMLLTCASAAHGTLSGA